MATAHRPIREELRIRGITIDPQQLAAAERAEALVEGLFAIARAIRRAYGLMVARLREAEARRELAAMTDLELADIGLNRSDVYRKDLSALARERAELDRTTTRTPRPANQNAAGRAAA